MGRPDPAQDKPAAPAGTIIKDLRIQGSLDLENGVPIRWKKPDGSGYVTVFVLDQNGTLQLCHDPYYWDATATDKEHGERRVIEVRNPRSKFPDFRLPVTRDRKDLPPGREFIDADSKLTLRSLNLVETNDPSELNFFRTGTDDPKNPDETGQPASGAVTGLIRWIGKSPRSGFTTDAEVIARGYNTPAGEHYGAVVFQVSDQRFPERKGGVLLVMKPGVRIGTVRGPGGGVTGAMLEVDSPDARPVVFRRPGAGPGQPVAVALAGGAEGTPADAANSLAVLKAEAIEAGSPRARLELQTNKGDRLETDWVLPVPAARLSRTEPQRVPSGELVPLVCEARGYDTDAMTRAGEPAGRLTCRTAGRYAVSVTAEFAANGQGSRQLVVRRNGRDIVGAVRVPAVAGETTQVTFTTPPVELRPGDYVEVLVRQTSGRPLEVPTTGELTPAVSMVRVG